MLIMESYRNLTYTSRDSSKTCPALDSLPALEDLVSGLPGT